MSETQAPIKLFATLFIIWLVLNGSVAAEVLAVGILVAGLLTIILNSKLTCFFGYRFTAASLVATVAFVFYFIVALVKANLAMATLVLSPKMPLKPAIVRIRTKLKNPVARLLLANCITLTPGTLSVEMGEEWLYIHWVVAEVTEVEAATQDIASGFERYLEVMYG